MRAPTFRPLALGAAAILAFGLVIGLGSDTSVSAAGEIKVTVCIMNSNGVHLVPGTTYYKIGSTAYFTGTLDANQCLNRDFPATTTNVEVWTTYNNTPSAHVTKNVAIDPVFTFQTRQVTLKLQTSDDAPLAGGTGKYGLGGAYGTWNFPGNPTNASGEVAAQLFPGVYSFEMSYQGTAQPKLSLTIPDADTTLVWETTTVTIAYPGQVSYGGPVGDSKWFKQTTATESKELLPSTVRFHLRGGITTDLTFSGDAFTYDAAPPMVGVSLVDPNGGEPDGSNGWFRTSPVSGKVEADDTLLGASPIQAIDCTGAAPTDFVGLGTAPFATAGFSVSAEGATTISCTATDSAGNTSPTPATRVVKIDTIAPTIVASATSAPNPNGWYPGPVTIHFVCSDGGSGIPAGNCPADEVLSGEGAGITS
ncbi:MAG TPA: hypothetical protein VFK59_11590, partial [Actinomycetota bacterium]|nr:hypothetical protein [Actinomycetota bacterium]